MSGSSGRVSTVIQAGNLKFLLPVLFFGGMVVSSAAGQAPGSASVTGQGAAEAQTLSANVDEVSLDLVAHDKKRKLVSDLKPEDFVVTDNEVPVKLKGLHLVTGDQSTEHLVTLLFDNFSGPSAKNAENTALKILKVLPSKGYSIATLGFIGRLRLIQGFTEDRNAVAQAVKTMTDNLDADKTPVLELTLSNSSVGSTTVKPNDKRITASEAAEKDLIAIARTGADPAGGARVDVKVRAQYQSLLTALESARQIQQDQHALSTLAGLLALVRSQQQFTARKCLIYFTARTQMDSHAKEMVQTITEAANQAGESVYVVDMNALDVGGQHQIDAAIGAQNVNFNPGPQAVPGSGGMATQVPTQQMGPGGPTSTAGMAVDWLRQGDPHPFAETKSPLAEMAMNTGGGYIDAQESLKRPLQQMVEDLTTYYQASYVPPFKEYDGSFRTIAIKPVRDGLNVKTKTGYVALAPGSAGGIRPFEAPLLKLLGQPDPPADLKFQAAVLHFGELPDGNTSTVAVEVPIAQLETRTDQHTNLFSAHVSIVAQIKDKSGTVVEHFAEDISRRGALETIEKDKSATINLQRHFPALPGQFTLEVAVLDRFSEKGGVKRIGFEVPPTQSSPSLSDIVLVRKVDTARDGDDPLEPMRFEKGRITPNLSGDVPQDAKSVSVFFILHPDAKSKDPVALEIEASRNGRPGKPSSVPLHLDNAQTAVPYMASFKSGLAPGDYEIKAVMSQGGKSSDQKISFTVEGDQRASSATLAANVAPGASAESSDALNTIAAGSMAPSNSSALSIVPITNPLPPPSQEEIKQLIADARDRALHYVDSLPNFMCIEVTSRSVDPSGAGRWKLRDTISELLSYRDKNETRTMLEVNGKVESANREGMKGAFSTGELGGVLQAVFLESAKADFEWKQTEALGTGTVQVFDYRVARNTSVFSVVGSNDKQIMVAFHGQVFIDALTRNIRRITLIADNLPADFPTRYTSIAVDYDYVAINAHDYLMPVSAELRLLQGRHDAVLNSMEFRNYRRFGSNMRIVTEPLPTDHP